MSAVGDEMASTIFDFSHVQRGNIIVIRFSVKIIFAMGWFAWSPSFSSQTVQSSSGVLALVLAVLVRNRVHRNN